MGLACLELETLFKCIDALSLEKCLDNEYLTFTKCVDKHTLTHMHACTHTYMVLFKDKAYFDEQFFEIGTILAMLT